MPDLRELNLPWVRVPVFPLVRSCSVLGGSFARRRARAGW
jgi:hypothetical protein